eukprot:4449489-Pleurochrysis_carterae.AAC.1
MESIKRLALEVIAMCVSPLQGAYEMCTLVPSVILIHYDSGMNLAVLSYWRSADNCLNNALWQQHIVTNSVREAAQTLEH